MVDKPPPIAQRLKIARQNAGLSQKQLGIAAGIDEFSASPRINQYERGKHTPDYATAERLASVLKVPVAYFYSKDDKLAELILLFNQLPAQHKRKVLAEFRVLVSGHADTNP
jgi:transcriptional regulator with XRE-family HTH domain